MLAPFDHPLIKIGERVTDIHDEEDALQRRTLAEVAFNHAPPRLVHPLRNLGITISWEIDQSPLLIQLKKIEQLGTTWRFADPGQGFLLSDRVDGT